MEIIVWIATIITIIAGSIEIFRASQKPEEKQLLVSIFWILALIIAGGYLAFFAYFGPKSAGDKFLDGLRRLDSVILEDVTCVDTALYNDLGLGSMIFNIAQFFANTQISDISFTPFTNQMSFRWSMGSMLSTTDIQNATLYIKAEDLFNFCVYSADGL